MQAAALLTNQGTGTLYGSKAASWATGLQTSDAAGDRTALPVGFGGTLVKKGLTAMNPDPPPAPGAPPPPTDQNNSANDTAAARKKARLEAGSGSAANILAGNSGGAPVTSSTVLLGS